MAVLYEVIKGFFFMMTIVYAGLLLKGDEIFSPATAELLSTLILPGYMVFCGIILGYVISLILVKKSESAYAQRKSYVQSFLIGSFLGIGLALVSIYSM